jgi:hypothetical protein
MTCSPLGRWLRGHQPFVEGNVVDGERETSAGKEAFKRGPNLCD